MVILCALLLALGIDRLVGFRSEPWVARWFGGYIAFAAHYCARCSWLSRSGHEFFLLGALLLPLVFILAICQSAFSFSPWSYFIVSFVLIWLALGTSDETEETTQARLWQALQSTFSVIFWLLLLGPLAALFYRLVFLLSTRPINEQLNAALQNAAVKLQSILDWIPARLLSLTLALIQGSAKVWWEHKKADNHTLITLCGAQLTLGNVRDSIHRCLFAWLLVILVGVLLRHFL